MPALPPIPITGLSAWKKWTLGTLAALAALYAVDVAGRVTVNKFVALQASALNDQQKKEVVTITKTLTAEGSYLAELKRAQSKIIEKMQEISNLQEQITLSQGQVTQSQEQIAQLNAKNAQLSLELLAQRDKRITDVLAIGIELHHIRTEIKSGNLIKKLGNAINGNVAIASVDKELAIINGMIAADEQAGMINHSNSNIQGLFKQFMTLKSQFK